MRHLQIETGSEVRDVTSPGRRTHPPLAAPGAENGLCQLTQSQSVHCVTKTPSSTALTPMIAAFARGRRPPIQVSARKNGKTTRPKRGSERSGHRELGSLSGSAKRSAEKTP